MVASLAVFAAFFAIVRPLGGRPTRLGAATLLRRGDVGSHPARTRARRTVHLSARGGRAARARVLLHAGGPTRVAGFRRGLSLAQSVTYTMGQHYAAVWIGYLLAAFALGVGNIYRRSPRNATIVVRVALGVCALVLAFASPTHWGHYLGPRTAHDRAVDRLLAGLPPELERRDPRRTLRAHRVRPQRVGRARRARPDSPCSTAPWPRRIGCEQHARRAARIAAAATGPCGNADGVTLYQRRDVGAAP